MSPKEFFNQFTTHQGIYEYVVKKLWEQNGISAMNSGICAYRSADGKKKCAIGHLIPDECYDENKMEFYNFDQIIDNLHDTMNPDLSDMVNFFNRFSIDFDHYEHKYDNFFLDMQNILHDRYNGRSPESTITYREYLKNASKSFAEQYGLFPYIFIE